MASNAVAAAITAGFNTLSEAIKAFSKWAEGSERRRMLRAIEIGEQMALRVRDADIQDDELQKMSRKFFKYNN